MRHRLGCFLIRLGFLLVGEEVREEAFRLLGIAGRKNII